MDRLNLNSFSLNAKLGAMTFKLWNFKIVVAVFEGGVGWDV